MSESMWKPEIQAFLGELDAAEASLDTLVLTIAEMEALVQASELRIRRLKQGLLAFDTQDVSRNMQEA